MSAARREALSAGSERRKLNLRPCQILSGAVFLLAAIANAGLGMLQFVIAVIIAGVLLPQAEGGARAAQAVATRLAGERGPGLITLDKATVRSVARGVVGGLLAYGLIGVFLGPVVIALGYELLRAWVRGEQKVLEQATA